MVDDEPTILAAVATRLRAEAFLVETAVDGPSAVATAAATTPDLVVLDVMLPGFDGLEVCRRIQAERSTPVLMLTARSDETDMLIGLGIGADDYLTKPFSMRELVARVRVLLRRVERVPEPQPVSVGGYRIDLQARRVHSGDDEVHLTRTEFDLLAFLAGRPGAAVARETLLEHVWGWASDVETRTVDSHVKALRRKLGSGADPHGARRRLCTGDAAMSGFGALWDRLPRPLDPFGSFKVKTGLARRRRNHLGVVHLLDRRQLAVPVRTAGRPGHLAGLHPVPGARDDLASAADDSRRRAMARGDYSIRVRATSRDEIGQLATAFNQMSADLGAADEYRRGLIANVSHELRTPIAALRAVLENVVDGVAEPDAETMRMALSQTERLGELVTNLLDLSRVEGGAIPLQLSRFGVDEFLRDAIEHVTYRAG